MIVIAQRHIIKKQILDLHISSDLQAFELQNKISSLYHRKIIPLIESACNQLGDPNQVQRIGSLDIDLGDIDLQTLEEDFVTKIADQLFEQLAEKLAPHPKASPFSPKQASATDHDNKKSVSQLPYQPGRFPLNLPSTKGAVSFLSPTTSNLKLFSYFLQTGHLPWWSESLSLQTLEDCCKQLLLTEPAALKALMMAQLKQANTVQRLIYQFSDPILIDMVSLLASTESSRVRHYIQDVRMLVPHVENWRGILPRQFRHRLWQGFFLQISLSSTLPLSVETMIQRSLYHLATCFKIDIPALFQQVYMAAEKRRVEGDRLNSSLLKVLQDHSATRDLKAGDQPLDRDSIATAILAEIEAIVTELETEIVPSTDEQAIHSSKVRVLSRLSAIAQSIKFKKLCTAPEVLGSIKHDVDALSPSMGKQGDQYRVENFLDPFNDSDEIYIQNAGLVLLWPFLHRFFIGLNLVQSHHFIDLSATKRAILFLQYLVDTSTEIPEHLLPLNKILCGLDLTDPIDVKLEITELEQTECDDLILAMIQNWRALKSTTLQGFRKAFLQRAGVLSMQNGNWRLNVEKETYDILLDQCPWNIQIVKCPWMTEIIQVDW